MRKEAGKIELCRKDIIYAVDFITNVVWVVAALIYFQGLALRIGPDEFVFEAIMAGSGIPFFGGFISIVMGVLEVNYGVKRIREGKQYEVIREWPMIWVIVKCMLLFLIVFTSILGIDVLEAVSLHI